MKYLHVRLILLLVTVGLVASTARIAAEDQVTSLPGLLITEIQVASESSASDEYIEIYNSQKTIFTAEDVQLQYMAATGNSWTTKAQFVLSLMPGDHYLLSTEAVSREADQVLSSGLAAGGGHIRLVVITSDQENELDRVGWGTALAPETLPATAPGIGEVLKRRFDEDGRPVDSNDNSNDIFISLSSQPQNSSFTPPAINDCPPQPNDSQQTTEETNNEDLSQVNQPPVSPINYQTVLISELLVDPKAPSSDKEDEFVEIFNPNPSAVNLEDYVIQTGSNFTYSYHLPYYSLAAGEYLAIFSIDSGLTLSNSGGIARILDPDSKVIDTTEAYSSAKAGQSWALIAGSWRWTTQPTPYEANIMSVEDSQDNETLNRRQSATALASTDTKDNTATETTAYVEPVIDKDSTISTSTLVLMGSVALLYFGYEYRQEIISGVQRLRDNFKAWCRNRT